MQYKRRERDADSQQAMNAVFLIAFVMMVLLVLSLILL